MISEELTVLKNIVLAVDGSEDSRAAIEMLCDLPLPAAATIHTISVLIPREASLRAWGLMAFLDQTQACFEAEGIHATQHLLSGYPAEEVMGFCEKEHPDLIVMGAKGLRATVGILLGGVTQQVVEYACCPVLVVRSPYRGIKRILLVVDGSAHSQWALDYFSRSPLARDSEMFVMHVLPPLITPDYVDLAGYPPMPGPAPGTMAEAEEAAARLALEEEREGNALLAHALARVEATGRQATGDLRRGDAATEIIEFVREGEIDLVVAGSRGLSQVEGWLLGSVSRKLVHYASCSVMIVKQPAEGH